MPYLLLVSGITNVLLSAIVVWQWLIK